MFEAHLSFRYELEPAFDDWLEEIGLKLTHLSLDDSEVQLMAITVAQGATSARSSDRAGSTASFMASARWRSSYEEALARAHGLAIELRARGAWVDRIKLEGELDAEGGLYLEHHVKVRYPLAARDALRAVARISNAHFSSTAQREADGFEERFLTRRFSIDARAEEDASLRALLELLPAAGAEIIKIERERVLYDESSLS